MDASALRYALQSLSMSRTPAPWQDKLIELCAQPRITCSQVLAEIDEPLSAMADEIPPEGWLRYAFDYAKHLLFPDPAFTAAAAPYKDAVEFYLGVLQVCLDAERDNAPFDPLVDFAFLSKEEAAEFDRGREYNTFRRAWQEQHAYTALRLGEEASPFRLLGHVAGVHHVAMTAARGLLAAGLPVDLSLASAAAAGHDLGKFGCKPGERVPYLHYY